MKVLIVSGRKSLKIPKTSLKFSIEEDLKYRLVKIIIAHTKILSKKLDELLLMEDCSRATNEV